MKKLILLIILLLIIPIGLAKTEKITMYPGMSRMIENSNITLISLDEKEFPKWLNILSHALKRFKGCIEMGLIFGSAIKSHNFNDIDILLMYCAEKSREVKKIKDEIRKSELIEKPIRYIDIIEKDILQNKEDKIFYNILSESLIFHAPEKYVEVVRKCRK